MAINADKPHLWERDVGLSVDMFNRWFTLFAPKTYRDSRAAITSRVEDGIRLTSDLTAISPEVLKQHPGILQVLETISKLVHRADVTACDTNRLHMPVGSIRGS